MTYKSGDVVYIRESQYGHETYFKTKVSHITPTGRISVNWRHGKKEQFNERGSIIGRSSLGYGAFFIDKEVFERGYAKQQRRAALKELARAALALENAIRQGRNVECAEGDLVTAVAAITIAKDTPQ